MDISPATHHAMLNWDKEFKKGEELFKQGCIEPDNNEAQSHGWQCAKAMRDLRSKYLKESRELTPKKLWAIKLTFGNGDTGYLPIGLKKANCFFTSQSVEDAEVFPSEAKAEAFRVKAVKTMFGDRSKCVEVLCQ